MFLILNFFLTDFQIKLENHVVFVYTVTALGIFYTIWLGILS